MAKMVMQIRLNVVYMYVAYLVTTKFITGEPGGVRLPGLLRLKEKYIWVP
jgi:hypothetical protein